MWTVPLAPRVTTLLGDHVIRIHRVVSEAVEHIVVEVDPIRWFAALDLVSCLEKHLETIWTLVDFVRFNLKIFVVQLYGLSWLNPPVAIQEGDLAYQWLVSSLSFTAV